jgi:ABC-type glycerol-3-phosphate transport system substrate-binding protein
LAFPGGVAGGEATVYNLMPFIWSAGGEIFDGEDVALDSEDTQRALQFLRELVNVSHVAPREVVTYRADTSPWLFATGQVAMALGGSYEGDLIYKTSGRGEEAFLQRVGCAPPPSAPGGVSVSTVGGISYVIPRQCRRPALVMDLLRFAVRPEVAGGLYRSMLQHSPYPSFNTYLHLEADGLLAQISRMIGLGRTRPSIPAYFGISRQLQTMFEAAISGSTPIDEIVERAAEFIYVVHRSPGPAFVDSSGGV